MWTMIAPVPLITRIPTRITPQPISPPLSSSPQAKCSQANGTIPKDVPLEVKMAAFQEVRTWCEEVWISVFVWGALLMLPPLPPRPPSGLLSAQ